MSRICIQAIFAVLALYKQETGILVYHSLIKIHNGTYKADSP